MNCKTQFRGGVMFRDCSILCLVVVFGFLLFDTPAAMAQVSGPMHRALPLTTRFGPATGCGAVINVFAVDGNGNATSFSVVPNNSTHNPYDNDDDTLIGVQNQSGANLTSITLNSTPLVQVDPLSHSKCQLLAMGPAFQRIFVLGDDRLRRA